MYNFVKKYVGYRQVLYARWINVYESQLNAGASVSTAQKAAFEEVTKYMVDNDAAFKMLVFPNPDGSRTVIERGGSGFLDTAGIMHAAEEVPDLFNRTEEELSGLGILITFLGDELTDYYKSGSLENYLKFLQ